MKSVYANAQGALSNSKPAELLLDCEKARVSGLFRVECSLGISFTWLRDGRVIDCRIGSLNGEPAFCCLMGVRAGSFSLEPGPVERAATFTGSTSDLLQRYNDHAESWQVLANTLPSFGSMLVLDRKKVAAEGSELSPEDKALLRLIDMRRRIYELVEESSAEPRVTLERVARFLDLGFAAVTASEAPAAGSSEARGIKVHGVRVISQPPDRATEPAPLQRPSQTIAGMPQVRPALAGALTEPTPAGQDSLFAESERPVDSSQEVSATEERLYIGRYELLSRLGRGGMGTVYLARATGEGGFSRLFALKVLRSHLASDELAAKALLDEARIASRLNHANVVGVVDVGVQGQQPYVVMDYVHGLSLAELLTHDPANGERVRVIPILLDALAGLSAAHKATDIDGTALRVIHHDISPHNFLVGVDGVTRLTDFGIARSGGQEGNSDNRGKPAFLSPERVFNEPVDARSDIFAFGALMWTALTGRRLFDAGDKPNTLRNVGRAEVRPPSEVAGSPRCFDAVCLKALQRDPRRRYQSADAMLLELRELAAREGYIGSPAEVSAWVREAMGGLADIGFDDPDQVRKFAEGIEGRGRGNVAATQPLTGPGATGRTIPIKNNERPRPLVRAAQWLAAALAIGVLFAAYWLPNSLVRPLDDRAVRRAETDGVSRAHGNRPEPPAIVSAVSSVAEHPDLGVTAPSSESPQSPVHEPGGPGVEPSPGTTPRVEAVSASVPDSPLRSQTKRAARHPKPRRDPAPVAEPPPAPEASTPSAQQPTPNQVAESASTANTAPQTEAPAP